MIATSIYVNTDDAQALLRQIDRAQSQLGKGLRDALQWGAYAWARSLGGMTRKSATKRKIVANPDKRALTDRRFAPFGVMAYKADKDEKGMSLGTKSLRFVPIYRTGEYGKIRFFDKRSASYFQRDQSNPKGRWVKLPSGPDPANPELYVPGIKDSPRLKIGRSGLAKKSWTQLMNRSAGGGQIRPMGIQNTGSVQWTGGSQVRVTNELRYIRSAINGGDSAVTRAAASAASWLNARINQELAKRMPR